MGMTYKIEGGDKWRGVLARIADNLEDTGVKAGVLTGATTTSGGATVAEYAYYNEYGTVNIPTRPFMRTTVTEHKKEWSSLFVQQVTGKTDNPGAVKTAWERVGRQIVGDIVAQIKSNMEPENAESTKKRKEKAVIGGKPGETMTPGTLIDTGLLINSISHEVLEGGDD